MNTKRLRSEDSVAVTEDPVRVESLNHDGQGVARRNGKALFIDGALPAELVRCTVIKKRRSYDRARMDEVVEPSMHRVAARCPWFGTCGGCSLQHLDPDAQIEVKQLQLLDDLARIGKCEPQVLLPAVRGPVWGYRRRARLGVRNVPKKGGILVGFRERAKSYIADMTSCDVLVPQIAQRLVDLRTLIGALSCFDRVPQIEIAAGDSASALVFRHLAPLTIADRELLAAFGERHGLQIHLQPEGLDSVHPLHPADPPPLQYGLARHGVVIHFAPTDFVQVNADVNAQAVDRVLELLDPRPGERVLDLFCGLGNFSLPLARRAKQVFGVEGDSALVARARTNALVNGIANAEFAVANLADEAGSAGWAGAHWDGILMDPPRTGCIDVANRIDACGARRIVYVSCNPSTLARDAQVLVHAHGYRLAAAGVMDMFPHTNHVESIALFER
jgi:23S rRNA (uracil1939-C5)-methyltransferase